LVEYKPNPSHELSNEARQRFLISAEARDHRLQHCGGVKAAEFDVVTRRSCDQFQKRELRPSVPLPERMDSIQLGETVSRCNSKSIGVELMELFGRGKVSEQLLLLGGNVLRIAENVAGVG
jgi:hypothetical protein